VVVREELQAKKPAVGRKLIDLPDYVFRVFVTNRSDSALEIWRDYNHRVGVECRIDELKNELAADHFCLRSFFATESAFLAVLFAFNLLSEFQRAIDPALKTYKQPATLRFELFTCGAILARSGHHLVLHICPKTGAVIPNENRYSTTSYIGLRQLLRSSINQHKSPHDFPQFCTSTSESRLSFLMLSRAIFSSSDTGCGRSMEAA
jgi:hypothetical protein